MSSSEKSVHHIEGWVPPKWATAQSLESKGMVSWSHESDTEVMCVSEEQGGSGDSLQLSIARFDQIGIDLDAGTVSVEEGVTYVHVYDNIELTAVEARKLARVLVELAEIVEAST
jgi:hypothetical protein